MKVPKLCKNGDGRAFAIYPNSGKRREYFGKYGSEEANKAYAAWLQKLMQGAVYTPPPVYNKSISSLAGRYLLERKATMSKETFATTKNFIIRFSDFAGTLSLEDISPLVLKNFAKYLISAKPGGKHKKALSRGYINRHTNNVLQFVRHCCVNEWVKPETWNKVAMVQRLKPGETGARETPRIQPVDLEAVKASLPWLPKPAADMVQVLYLCGMRPQDVIQMKWEEIDETGDVWIYRPTHHKNTHRGQDLIKAIPVPAQAILGNRRGAGHVFKKSDGQPFSPRYLNETINRSIERAKVRGITIPHWHPNQLRHSIATHVRRDHGREAAKEYLGHENVETTSIYAERTVEVIKEIASKITTNPLQPQQTECVSSTHPEGS